MPGRVVGKEFRAHWTAILDRRFLLHYSWPELGPGLSKNMALTHAVGTWQGPFCNLRLLLKTCRLGCAKISGDRVCIVEVQVATDGLTKFVPAGDFCFCRVAENPLLSRFTQSCRLASGINCHLDPIKTAVFAQGRVSSEIDAVYQEEKIW